MRLRLALLLSGGDAQKQIACHKRAPLSPGGAKAVTALQRHPLVRLTSILEDSPTARVYFRASGGLARLAGATSAAARCWDGSVNRAASADCQGTNETRAAPARSPAANCTAAAASTEECGVVSGDRDGDSGDSDSPTAAARLEEDRATFASMLRAVAAALKGGERLAQIEVSKSGLLGAPCYQSMRAVFDGARGGAAAAAAAAAVLLLSRVVDDVSVRAHVAR